MDKQQAWDYALGIIKVDGLEPSPEFLAMAEKEKRGELTLEDIKWTLDVKYTVKKDAVPVKKCAIVIYQQNLGIKSCRTGLLGRDK